jgi:hypothetical protein
MFAKSWTLGQTSLKLTYRQPEISLPFASHKQFLIASSSHCSLYCATHYSSGFSRHSLRIQGLHHQQLKMEANGGEMCPQNLAQTRESSRVLATITTYLSLDGKKEAFATAMGSFIAQHAACDELSNIDALYVFNEVANSREESKACERWLQKFFKVFNLPFKVHIIQKFVDGEKGHALSLNKIMRLLKGYDFHIHLEESWFYTSKWLGKAIEIMKNNQHISQLQLTPDRWDHDQLYYKLRKRSGFYEVHPTQEWHEAIKKHDHHTCTPDDLTLEIEDYWPLYSLRPSINNVSKISTLSMFEEDPEWFPRKFEWKYSLEWAAHGNRKAVICPLVAQRFPNHISTYEKSPQE